MTSPHLLQGWIALQHSREDAFGDHLDASPRSDAGVVANPVADGFPGHLAHGLGHSSRGCPGGQPPGLEHHDAPISKPRLAEQRERYACRLAGPRWGLQDGRAGAP